MHCAHVHLKLLPHAMMREAYGKMFAVENTRRITPTPSKSEGLADTLAGSAPSTTVSQPVDAIMREASRKMSAMEYTRRITSTPSQFEGLADTLGREGFEISLVVPVVMLKNPPRITATTSQSKGLADTPEREDLEISLLVPVVEENSSLREVYRKMFALENPQRITTITSQPVNEDTGQEKHKSL